MKKLISLLLCAIAMLALFAGCGKENPAEADGNPTSQITPDSTLPGGETAAVTTAGPVLPDTTYDGYEFIILVTGNLDNNDFAASKDDSDVIGSARFRWISDAEEKFDITISNKEEIKFNTANGSGTGYKLISSNYKSQEPMYDAAMIGTYDVAQLSLGGYLTDLNSVPYINLANDWWDQKANEDMEIHGRMYYTTGDISLTDNMVTHCILFNKRMVLDAKLESPYQLVYQDKWYFDKYAEMVKTVGEDLSGDDKMDAKDRYGLMTSNGTMLQILGSARERICTINEDGEMVLTLYSDRIVSIYDEYCAFAFDSNHVFNYQYGIAKADWNETRTSAFDENRAMFYDTLFTTVPKHRDSETDFGIIPFPKFDETQSDYGHQISAFHSQFLCVPGVIRDDEMTGAVIEYLAYTGQKTMTPAYYERSLVGTHIRDDESADMLEIIFDSRVYDVGIYYNIGGYKDQFANFFSNRNMTLTTVYETYKLRATGTLDTINERFSDES